MRQLGSLTLSLLSANLSERCALLWRGVIWSLWLQQQLVREGG